MYKLFLLLYYSRLEAACRNVYRKNWAKVTKLVPVDSDSPWGPVQRIILHNHIKLNRLFLVHAPLSRFLIKSYLAILNLCDAMADSSGGSQREPSRSESLSPSKTTKIFLKVPSTPTTSTSAVRRTGRVFVSAPLLPSAQKRQYKHISETSLNLDARARIDEVIGEYLVVDTLYYYARYDGGIAYKV